jgi:hypothetical protein
LTSNPKRYKINTKKKLKKGENNMTIKNSHEVEINFETAVQLMDDEIRENLHPEYDNAQEFFNAYCKAHKQKFSEEFELDKKNPIY